MNYRDNERGQFLGSSVKKWFQKDAHSHFGICCLPFHKQIIETALSSRLHFIVSFFLA